MKIKFTDFGRCLVCLHNPCDCKAEVDELQEHTVGSEAKVNTSEVLEDEGKK